MNNVVVVNPDETIALGQNAISVTPVELDVQPHIVLNLVSVEFPNKRYMYACIGFDLMKILFVYNLFFSLHLVLQFLSCVVCFEGLNRNSVQRIKQYGAFHLIEMLIVIGMFYYERSLLLIVIGVILIFDVVCYIVVNKYTHQLQLALNNINS